ncbi:MAG: smalltalk protein [Bacteroides sp.]|nr:smalltalk protein [Bacteroides sp.]
MDSNQPSKPSKSSTWSIILKVIITVATAIAGALGISSCICDL